MHDLEHHPGWIAVNRALWLLGTPVVAAYATAILIYGPGLRAASEDAAQQQIMAEHAVICDKLGNAQGSSGWEPCLNLLLQLQQRHEQSYAVRSTGPF